MVCCAPASRHFEYIGHLLTMEDGVAKRKDATDRKALHKKAYKKAVSDLVTTKNANYGNIIEDSVYLHAISKLKAIGKIVNLSALRVVVH